MDYLIQGNSDMEKRNCECCGVEYETNINRTRCSEKCSKIMKNRRHRNNSILKVKYPKEQIVHTNKNIFGFVTKSVY